MTSGLWSRRGLLLGGVVLAAGAASLTGCVAGLGDSGSPAPTRRRPRWPVDAGDVVGYQRRDGVTLRLAVAAVQEPGEDLDYLRMAAMAVDSQGAHLPLDFAATVVDGPGYVPVGRPAEPMPMRTALEQAADVIETGRDIITPGYVMLVPDGDGTDDEPVAAAFRAEASGRAVPEMNGYAIQLTWRQLAASLERVELPGTR